MKTYADAQSGRDDALMLIERKRENKLWLITAWRFLLDYCVDHPVVFVDDLWAAGMPTPPGDPRSMGAPIGKARRRGVLVPTGTHRESVRSNLQVKEVWAVDPVNLAIELGKLS